MKTPKFLSFLFLLTTFLLFCTQTVQATDDSFIISNDIQNQINKLTAIDPSNKDYIDSIIINFHKDIHTNSDELNQLLTNAIVSLNELNKISEDEYMKTVEKQEEIIKNTPQAKAA